MPIKEQLIDLYEQGLFLREIGDCYNVSDSTVLKWFKIHNIPRRVGTSTRPKNNNKYNRNCDFFKTWSREMAWVLGWIAADGCVSKNTLNITLTDEQILHKIKTIMSYDGPVKLKNSPSLQNSSIKRVPQYYITINSKTIVEDLIKLNVTPNKSLTLKIPPVPSEYVWDFIRGYFEGDGHIHHNADTKCKQLGFRGSLDMLNSLNKIICDEIQANSKKIIFPKNNKIPMLRFCAKKDIVLIAKNMYFGETGHMRLDRKYDKLQLIMG